MKSPAEIVNFGAGINSTALIVEMVRRNMKPDYVIFADTGSEMPETYEHIERMRKWFKENGLEFVVVKSKYDCSVYDYYYSRKLTPSRQFRDCTDKFKIQPILRFVKQFKEQKVVQHIGICYDEVYRIRPSKTKWIQFRYLLAEWKMTREDCIKSIEEAGLEVPVKSGCFMCPFQTKESWIELLKTKPELFKKAREMEENGRRYPEITLTYSHTLKAYEKAVKEQRTLTEFGVRSICDGWCMT